MKQVDIFVAADIRGKQRGTGRTMYIMRSRKKDGTDYESLPSVTESDNATEGRLVLMAVRDAIQRLNYACSVVIHTESTYISSAINNRWPETWSVNGWRNTKGKEIQDSILWSQIIQIADEVGHELSAEQGSHELAHWMRWKMNIAEVYKDIFCEVKEKRGTNERE